MDSGKFLAALAAICAPACLVAAVPEVSGVAMSQARDRTVTISYSLSEPAVVTLDIVTNSPAGWASIGVANVMKVSGDVWKLVGGDGTHAITWHPDKDWAGNTVKLSAGGVKAVVTAWAKDDPPDYMVVDISSDVAGQAVNFYPSEEHLPGGLLGDSAYRLSKIVMRRIHAANVLWTMGSNFEKGRYVDSEAAHTVSLAYDYYIGVFELTQGQFAAITGIGDMSGDRTFDDSPLRPMNNVSYNKMRCAPCTKAGANTYLGGGWPNDPYEGSFLDLLRARTGIAFDLPTEAEWEFACRSGTHEGQWNDGSARTDENLPGEWKGDKANFVTQPCGSFASSKWGLYDMHGNVYELCHDWHQDDIVGLGGAANVDPTNPLNRHDGTAGSGRVRRGGACHTAANACTTSIRNVSYDPASPNTRWGYRLVCPAGFAD